MKKLTLNGRKIWAIKVPDGEVVVKSSPLSPKNNFYYSEKDGKVLFSISKQYMVLGRPSEITEKVARGLVPEVESVIPKYFNYPNGGEGLTAIESLLSWCKANNITNQLLIIKRPEQN